MSNFQGFEQLITENTVLALKELFNIDITPSQVTLNEPPKDFDGECTLVIFPFVRFTKKSPEETGQMIGNFLKEKIPFVRETTAVKGFLNIAFSDEYWMQFLTQEALLPDFGKPQPKAEKILIEYSSPNTNKPLHLGHVRNIVLGNALEGLLKEAGYDVSTCCLVNDRGIHICKSMLAWQLSGLNETPESSGLKGDKLVGKYYVEFDKLYNAQAKQCLENWQKGDFSGCSTAVQDKYLLLTGKLAASQDEDECKKLESAIKDLAKENTPIMAQAREMLLKWEAGDEATLSLWKTMNQWVYDGFAVTYKEMGVSFDKFYYESNTYLLGKDTIQKGLKEGIFYKKDDNSVWIDLTADGLDEKLVLRGDGTSVYITQDIGTANLKYNEFQMDKSIYVVGNEQDYHFKVLKLILQKLKEPHAEGLLHFSYGMVDLPSGKMKSREGTVVDADDLMQDMILAAKSQTEELGKVEGLSEEEAWDLYKIVGLGALKFFLLRVDPRKRILFNPEESIDLHGYTATFVQYTYARIQSILKRAETVEVSENPSKTTLETLEKEVLQLLYKYSQTLEIAATELNPARIIDFAYEVAKLYNKLYAHLSIFAAENEADTVFRIQLSKACGQLIRRCFNMLGLEVPNRM